MLQYPLYTALYRLQHVPRWGIIPTIKQQSVAEHTFGVMVAFDWLADLLNISLSAADFKTALYHDASEAITGDMPTPFKSSKNVDRLTGGYENTLGTNAYASLINKYLVSLADKLEALSFLQQEKMLGNKSLDGIFSSMSRLFIKQFEEFVKQFCYIANIDEKHQNASDIMCLWLALTNPIMHIGVTHA